MNENRLYNGSTDCIEGDVINRESMLFVTGFDDHKPIDEKEYFGSKLYYNTTIPTLVIGMVFYNEDVKEVHRTLECIGHQLLDLRDVCKTQVVVVGDGVKQMDSTTAQYLKQLFCITVDDINVWDDMISDLEQSKDKTYIIQRSLPGDNQICCVTVGVDKHQYPMTLILKSENRRKHNSQEWILNSFTPQCFISNSLASSSQNYNNLYVLLTDCGTLFQDKCLYRLLKYMIRHPNCVGTTARQRVMTSKEQNMNDESWFSVSKFFRIIQLADYEVSYATYTGAFSAAGCLPVLPGPCAMFRYSGLMSKRDIDTFLNKNSDIENLNNNSNLKESALQHYNNLVNINIEDTNIFIENVKLAEDRIPSYSIITHGDGKAYTTWVDGAVFKFQAESTLRSFILQRRRWINGAFACYVWNCLVHPGLILRSKIAWYRKLFIMLLYWMQMLNYIFAMCTYGVMAGSLYISLLSLFNIDSKISLMITMIYGSIAINHLVVHKFHVFSWLLTTIMILVNSIVLGIIVSGFIHEIVKWGGVINDDIGRMIIVFSAIAIVASPFIMAVVSLDFKSMGYVLLSFIPYWLFLPTLVGTFVLYSVSRFSDITWGNRFSKASSSFHNATSEQIDTLRSKMDIISGVMLFCVILANIGVTVILILFYTNAIVIGIILASVIGVFLLQCLMSIIYFAVKHISCATCVQRLS